MALYHYKAMNQAGKETKGEITADSKQGAVANLKSKGLYPLQLDEKKEKAAVSSMNIEIFKQGIKKKHVAIFARQFASMLQAGVPLPVILDVLMQQERNPTFLKILQSINDDIMSGNTLSGAMSKFKEFPQLMTSMVEVGEANGRLDMAFERIAVNLEKEIKLVAKIKGAMIYPIVLLSVTVLAGILLSVFVLPRFASMFEQSGAELPLLTKILMGFSDFMINRWYVVLGIVVLLVVLGVVAFKDPKIRRQLDQYLLKIPVVGRTQNIVLMARFSRTFSALVEGGVGLVVSLETVRNVISNRYVKESFHTIIEDIQSGMTITKAIAKHKMFTPLVVSMTRIGEESGRLGEVLQKTAEFYEDESEAQLQKMMALAEPMMTVIMAVGISILVLGIVMPMFQMYQNVGK